MKLHAVVSRLEKLPNVRFTNNRPLINTMFAKGDAFYILITKSPGSQDDARRIEFEFSISGVTSPSSWVETLLLALSEAGCAIPSGAFEKIQDTITNGLSGGAGLNLLGSNLSIVVRPGIADAVILSVLSE